MRIEHWLYTIPLRLRSLFRLPRVAASRESDIDARHTESIASASVCACEFSSATFVHCLSSLA